MLYQGLYIHFAFFLPSFSISEKFNMKTTTEETKPIAITDKLVKFELAKKN